MGPLLLVFPPQGQSGISTSGSGWKVDSEMDLGAPGVHRSPSSLPPSVPAPDRPGCASRVPPHSSVSMAQPHCPSFLELPYSLQVSERRLRPLPQKQRTLHEKILEEIKQERRLRPVGGQCWGGRGEHRTPPPAHLPSITSPFLLRPHLLTFLSCPTSLPPPGFGSLPCILNACSGDSKSTSCINLSITDAGNNSQRPRPRVLLKAPTLAEMEEMNTSEVRAHGFLERGQGGGGGASEKG